MVLSGKLGTKGTGLDFPHDWLQRISDMENQKMLRRLQFFELGHCYCLLFYVHPTGWYKARLWGPGQIPTDCGHEQVTFSS
jgi:hypothetical protein